MSRSDLVLAALFVVVSVAAPGPAARIAWSGEGVETSSKGVSMDDVPEAARKTLLEHAGTSKIRELEEKVVDGKTVYEAEVMIDGKEIEIVVAPNGELVMIKGDAAVAMSRSDDARWRRNFDVDKKRLTPHGTHPYFPLTPGFKVHLTDGTETVILSVLEDTKVVDGVETRVVEERETVDGELVEISRNYFAIDASSGDLYYFGEDVDDYEDGKVVSHDGGWLSGVNGAKFGMLLPGKPTVGDKYYLEDAPGAVERVEVVELDAKLKTPLREFDKVVHCREHDMIDGGESSKWYAPGVGMIGDDAMRLTKIEEPAP